MPDEVQESWFKYDISKLDKQSEDCALTRHLYFWSEASYCDEERVFDVRGRLGARGVKIVTWEADVLLSERLCRADRFFGGVEGVCRNVTNIADIYVIYMLN
jgi:hypothetical protein